LTDIFRKDLASKPQYVLIAQQWPNVLLGYEPVEKPQKGNFVASN
jgi:hypothetical protein